MDIKEGLKLRGEVTVTVFSSDLSDEQFTAFLDGLPTEAVVETALYPNLITNVGRQRATQLIVGDSTVYFSQIAVSTSVIAPALADTVLPSELFRKAISIRQSINTYYARFSVYFATNDWNSTAINACGLFDTASTGGTMGSDASITLSKSATQAASVDWRWLVSS